MGAAQEMAWQEAGPQGAVCFTPRALHTPGKETRACGQQKLSTAQPRQLCFLAKLHLGNSLAVLLKPGTCGQQPRRFAAGVREGSAEYSRKGKGSPPPACTWAPGRQAEPGRVGAGGGSRRCPRTGRACSTPSRCCRSPVPASLNWGRTPRDGLCSARPESDGLRWLVIQAQLENNSNPL